VLAEFVAFFRGNEPFEDAAQDVGPNLFEIERANAPIKSKDANGTLNEMNSKPCCLNPLSRPISPSSQNDPSNLSEWWRVSRLSSVKSMCRVGYRFYYGFRHVLPVRSVRPILKRCGDGFRKCLIDNGCDPRSLQVRL
jgi:hypothetical protein